MRPTRFEAFVLDLAKNTPGVTRVQTLADAGDTTHPFGLAVTTGNGEARWQIIGQLAPGEKHDQPDAPVNGEPFTAGAEPGDAEVWLAAVIGRAECPEIANVERWSTRAGGKGGPGLTVRFHNGAKVFVRKI